MENTNNQALMSDKINELASALSKAQSTIENVAKDKQGYGYKYADLASCLHAVKKPLADNGLSISQLVSQDNENKPVLVTLLIHESGQWLKSTFNIESVVMKQGNALQHLGAGLTYVRRYALSAIVGLTQEDDDAKSIISNAPVEKSETVNWSQQLRSLCKEHDIIASQFANFHNIVSTDINSMKNGVTNFLTLKEEFEKAAKESLENAA